MQWLNRLLTLGHISILTSPIILSYIMLHNTLYFRIKSALLYFIYYPRNKLLFNLGQKQWQHNLFAIGYKFLVGRTNNICETFYNIFSHETNLR